MKYHSWLGLPACQALAGQRPVIANFDWPVPGTLAGL
jgi:hypothetical protein